MQSSPDGVRPLPAPSRSTIGDGSVPPRPRNASSSQRASAGSVRAKCRSRELFRRMGRGASTARRSGRRPRTCTIRSPRGARAASAERIKASPARTVVGDGTGWRGGVHASRVETANMPNPSIARMAPWNRQARPCSSGVPGLKPSTGTLSGPRGAERGMRQAIPPAPSRYVADLNAASTEPRPAMSARRAGRPTCARAGVASGIRGTGIPPRRHGAGSGALAFDRDRHSAGPVGHDRPA